jgi:alpha-D-ribose 1-methylphosphonate 5-triphosphate synthase subunit PhnI
MSANITTTGQLRDFLSRVMVAVNKGDCKIDEARAMVKLAEKINESFYAELKVAQINTQLQRQVDALGGLSLNEAGK